MPRLSKVIHLIDQFTLLLGKLIAGLTVLMVITMFLIVVLRYGFNLGWIAMQESVLYLHGAIFMLGAGYTLLANGHVRVDIFYQRFSVKQQAWVNLLGTLFLLMPVTVFIVIISFDYVHTSWMIMEKSQEAGGLPLVYLNKSLIIVFAVTLFIQGIAELLKAIQQLQHQSMGEVKQ